MACTGSHQAAPQNFSWRRVVSLALLLAPLTTATAVAQQEKQSSAEAVAVYSDAANFQNNGAFELAADEWDKFLKRFADDPLAPKATHYSGVCNMQLKRYDKAIERFNLYVTKHAGGELEQDAYLNLGWSQYSAAQQQQDEAQKKALYDSAAQSFAKLAEKYPQGKYVDQALFFQGESLYRQGKKKEAIAAYDGLVANHAKSKLRVDGVYALGVTHEELGQFAAAGKAYDIFLEEFADSPLVTEVRMRKAETVMQAGEYADAEKRFAEVAAVEGFASADHAAMRQAFCAAKQDEYGRAGNLYAMLASNFPKSDLREEAALEAGRNLYRAKKYDDALTWFDDVIKNSPGAASEAAHWNSRIYLAKGQAAKAAELAQKSLEAAAGGPYEANLKFDLAEAQLASQDGKQAAYQGFLSVVENHGDHEIAPQALYNAAFAAVELKKFDEAVQHAATFAEKYPDHRLLPDVEYLAAESKLQKEQHAEAAEQFAALLANHSNHPDIDAWRLRHALVLLLQKKYDEVIAALSPAVANIKAPAQKAEAQHYMGVSQFRLNKFAEAAASLQAAITADAKWRQADESLLYLSRAQHKAGQTDGAIATVNKLIADFPKSSLAAEAHYRLGEYSFAKKDYDTAATEYATVVESAPKSVFVPYANYGRGWALLKKNDYENSAAAFTALLDSGDEHPLKSEALFARAMANRQLGEHQAAIDDVNAYLAAGDKLENKQAALYERGLAETALKKFEDAAKSYEAVLAEEGAYADEDKVLYELGWAYKSLEAKEKASDAFSRLAEKHADSPLAAEALFHVGEDLYGKKEYAEAQKKYAAAKAKAGKSDLGERIVYKLGWSHYQQEQWQPALDAFTEQLANYTESKLRSEGLFMQAECHFRLKQYEEALKGYEAALAAGAESPTVEVLARLHGGQSAAQLKQWEKSVALLTPVAEKFPESYYVGEALYELGWAKQNLKAYDEALALYEKAVAENRGAIGARSRFMRGEIFFEQKEFDKAVPEFQRVMFGFGGDKAEADVKKWQAKSGYEAGRCKEVQIADAQGAARTKLIADAKKFYGYVVEKHPDDPLAATAQQRLEALAKL